jgi:hypothetical protein
MLRHVALVRTDILEEHITSIITATWRNIPEDGIPHCHCREDIKSYMQFA